MLIFYLCDGAQVLNIQQKSYDRDFFIFLMVIVLIFSCGTKADSKRCGVSNPHPHPLPPANRATLRERAVQCAVRVDSAWLASASLQLCSFLRRLRRTGWFLHVFGDSSFCKRNLV